MNPIPMGVRMQRMSQISAAGAAAIAMAAVLGAGGCAANIEPPAGYAPLGRVSGDRLFTARSPEGGAFAVSRRTNPGGKYADLDYWVRAFRREKVDLGAYRLAAEEDIVTASGRKGRMLDLRSGTGGTEYTWLVAIFVEEATITTAEAGGPSPTVAADRGKLVAAVKGLRI